MANENLSFKLITDNKNTFFTNNKFISAESLPVEGDFVKGDIIVNIGETADTEAMWVCIESGNPGVWEVVGAGVSNGNNNGGGSNNLVGLKNNVTLESDANEVEIGIEGFNKNNDMMTVYKNSVYMMEGKDYEFNEAGDRIVAMNGGVFKAGTVFGFVVLKEVPVVEEGEVIDGRVIEDGSIGLDKLDAEVKEAIEAAGNIDMSEYVSEEELEAKGYLTEHQDLSGYATKEELNNIDMSGKQDKVDNSLVTNDKSIVGAINELFQDVDSGKGIIADAIDDRNISKDSTFAAMGEAIEGIHADREEDRQKLIEILQGSNMNLSGNESMDTLLDLIDMSNIDLSKVVQMDGGSGYSFIVYDDGSVYSCGQNDYGQLGLGDTTNRAIFAQVTTNVNNDVKQVACGDAHTFILKNDGSVWSCGYNYNGQLGLGTSGSSNNKTTFTQVTTNINNDVKQIDCGTSHTAILKNDGSVWSCGYNQYGTLGLNNTTDKYTFTQVTTNINNDVKQISCIANEIIILKNDGSVWGCGYNNYGQLGLGDTTKRTTFTQITTNGKKISSNNCSMLILKNDGSLWGCGLNDGGQLGCDSDTGSMTAMNKSLTQVTVNINNDVNEIFCGYNHSLIIKNDGSIWVAGSNSKGQLGLGDANSRNRFTELVNSDSLNNAILQLQTEAIINRGNLATVLTDEGVELTGDETLADLIVKVDEEFDRQVAPIEFRRGAVVECNVSVDGSKGKNNGTRYSDTISTTVTTNFGFIPSIIILYFDIGGDNVVSGDIYDLSGTLEILIDNTNVSNSLLYATSVTENSFTLVSRNARDRNDGTGDLYYYKGTVIKIYGIE